MTRTLPALVAILAMPLVLAAQTDRGAGGFVAAQAAAKNPLRVALLVDTSAGVTAAGLTEVRKALVAFLDVLPADAEVGLVSTGRRVQVIVKPTTDRKRLDGAAAGLILDGGPTPLMNALVEVDDRFFHKAAGVSPVFVIVTGDGSESSVDVDDKAFNGWLNGLRSRGIVGHAFVMKYQTDGMPDMVAGAVARATGGRYESMGNASPLAEKLKALAAALGQE